MTPREAAPGTGTLWPMTDMCPTLRGMHVVTERGHSKWRIEAITDPLDPVERLRAEGRILPARAHPTPWSEPQGTGSPQKVEALLAELRDGD